MKYVTRVERYSIYYDGDRLYVEDKADSSSFAAIFELPPNMDEDNPIEWLEKNLESSDGYMDMIFRLKKTHGRVSQDNIPQGKPVDRRPRQEGSNQPVPAPDDEPEPPEWANPDLGKQPRYPGKVNN